MQIHDDCGCPSTHQRHFISTDIVCSDAHSKRDECFIGTLTDEAVEEMNKDAQRAAEALAKVKEERKGLTLQPDNFTRATLVKKTVVSHDTRYVISHE